VSDLAEFYQGLVLPSSPEKDEPFVFCAENLQPPPAKMTCDSLIVERGLHGYGHALASVVHVHAPREIYRQLGVLLLATVFHRDLDVEIELTHEHAVVKKLVVERPWIMSRPSKYETRPHSFTYWPDARVNFDEDDARNGGASPNCVVSPTTVFDSSCDRGRVLLGGLLLDIGREGTDKLEYHLEGELGYRGAGPGSAEVSFWLPGSDAWDPDLWALESKLKQTQAGHGRNRHD
jgi:hypothetical protein